ncbi:Serine/threonine-protein kinase Nek11 [Cichlidogyrus casuarinus]|uniref:non-specific serine/threonine protein kinase n=1 Tax=Cichlidogyrus casuarinus TaxID=1844966 RepID=A0ABD2QLH5_9PLAT
MTSDAPKIYANRYKVVRKLGKGAFGTVFLVNDSKLNDNDDNAKALKVSEIEDFEMEETQSVIKEARMMSKLNHPYIVKFMDSFLDKNSICILTEFCEGGDLTDFIKNMKINGEQMNEEKASRWFTQMLLGTSYLHSKRMLHRDLKSRYS